MYYFANLYVSLIPLWLSIMIKLLYKYYEIYGLNIRLHILRKHMFHMVFIMAILILLMISLIVLVSFLKIKNKLESSTGYVIDYKIKKSFTMEYMFVYVLPLFAFDFLSVDGIILFLIYFLFLTILVCKYNYFMGNIICEILGYKYYECKIKTNLCDSCLEKIVMSKKNILKGDDINIYNINNEVALNIIHD